MPEVKSAHSRQTETLSLQNHIHKDKTYGVMFYWFEMRVWILLTKLGLLPAHCRLSAAEQAGT